MSLLDPAWLHTAPSKRWLVAVSGGRDSVALLHACHASGLTDLVVCHINHQLRGEESDGDEALVLKLAQRYGLRTSFHSLDVASIAKTEKKSIELAAREARHEAFSRACETFSCAGVLLAHHADDQAETTLFNLLRGSAGLKGMASISQIERHAITLHRPLLQSRRSEINDYILQHKLSYREDSSNAEADATRNRLRNEAIPLLGEILGRDITPAVNSALQHQQLADAFIESKMDYPSMLDPQGRIHLPSLTASATIIQQQVLHRYLSEHRICKLSQQLIASCLTLTDPSKPAKINLPGNNYLRRKAQRLFICEGDNPRTERQ